MGVKHFCIDDFVITYTIFDLKSDQGHQITLIFFYHLLEAHLDMSLNLLLSHWLYTTLMKFNSLKDQRSYLIELNRLNRELLFHHLQNKAMLWFSLHLNKGGSNGTTRLQKIYSCVFTLPHLSDGFMLMSPYHKIEKARYHIIHDTFPFWCSKE